MQYIKNDQPMHLPYTYRLDDGSMQSGFDRLTDAKRISLAGVYPLVETQTIEPWQSKSLPVYEYTATECSVTYTLTDKPLEIYKQEKIAAAYQAANNQLDSLVQGYSQLEVATWPMIQADVLAFTASAVIGQYMQAAIDTSGYTAQGLADLLLPRFAEQAAILATRKTTVEAIMLAADHAAVKAVT